ncbi:MAG: hypothetical protein HC859_11500 [Bacteroidia bacterium]|nr:hypothetical protein [Bacteroidia bacterium]
MRLKKYSRLVPAFPNAASKRVAVPTLSEVADDWLTYFRGLARYKTDQRLLKRIGPVAFGIELEKYLPDSYRPRMIVYNLIEAGSKLVPVVDHLAKDNRGLQIFIPYTSHAKRYTEACELMARQARVKLLTRPAPEDVINGIIAYVENDAVGDCFWSCQAVLQLSQLLSRKPNATNIFRSAPTSFASMCPLQFSNNTRRAAKRNGYMTSTSLTLAR